MDSSVPGTRFGMRKGLHTAGGARPAMRMPFRRWSFFHLVVLFLVGFLIGTFGSSAGFAQAVDPKEEAEAAKQRLLDQEASEHRARLPVYDPEKEARKERERLGLPPPIEAAPLRAAPRRASTPLETTTEWTSVVEVRGRAVQGLQLSMVALRNANVEASELLSAAPWLDALPRDLRSKLIYDADSRSLVLKGPIDSAEVESLWAQLPSAMDRQAVERLIQPRYEYGKPLFLFLTLYNLSLPQRTLEEIPACGSLARSDPLQFRIVAANGEELVLSNPYTDNDAVHPHPPLVVEGGDQLDAVFDLNGWIHVSGALRDMLGRTEAVTITAEIPTLSLASAPVEVLVQ